MAAFGAETPASCHQPACQCSSPGVAWAVSPSSPCAVAPWTQCAAPFRPVCLPAIARPSSQLAGSPRELFAVVRVSRRLVCTAACLAAACLAGGQPAILAASADLPASCVPRWLGTCRPALIPAWCATPLKRNPRGCHLQTTVASLLLPTERVCCCGRIMWPRRLRPGSGGDGVAGRTTQPLVHSVGCLVNKLGWCLG